MDFHGLDLWVSLRVIPFAGGILAHGRKSASVIAVIDVSIRIADGMERARIKSGGWFY